MKHLYIAANIAAGCRKQKVEKLLSCIHNKGHNIIMNSFQIGFLESSRRSFSLAGIFIQKPIWLPYSGIFSRDKIGLLQIFAEIDFADQEFSLAMPTRQPYALFVLIVATTLSLAAHFKIQVFLLRGELRPGSS